MNEQKTSAPIRSSIYEENMLVLKKALLCVAAAVVIGLLFLGACALSGVFGSL